MFAGRSVAILCMVAGSLFAQPATTTIQDTLFKADGTPFNGSVVVTWNNFQTQDAAAIGQQTATFPIVNGAVFVQLAPNTNAIPVNNYTANYESDGLVQFTEIWAVPPSTTPLRLAAVRVVNGATASPTPTSGSTGGGGTTTAPSGQIQETDVVGLPADLSIRPVRGPGYLPGRSAIINMSGELEAISGDPGDCVHVDGSTGSCSGIDASQMASFIDSETPGGAIDGNNVNFTLANAPMPAVSLSLFRNGVYQTTGTDYSLNGSAIQFLTGATPQPGDVLTATYRIGGSAAGPNVYSVNTAFPLSGGGALQGNLTLSLIDAAFLRRGHRTMVIGDGQAGVSSPDSTFPTLTSNWFNQAVLESQSEIRYAGNAGLAGDTTANMLNRLATDVIAQNPDKVFIEAGYSDINAEVPVTTIASNINAIVVQLKAANILPILCTLPPRLPADVNGVSAASTVSLVQLNLQIRHIADLQGLTLVDFYSVLVDPSTGQYRSGYSSDGINPIMPATNAMAQTAIVATQLLYDVTSPWLTANDKDPVNLIQDPVFVEVPTHWVQSTPTGIPARLTLSSSSARQFAEAAEDRHWQHQRRHRERYYAGLLRRRPPGLLRNHQQHELPSGQPAVRCSAAVQSRRFHDVSAVSLVRGYTERCVVCGIHGSGGRDIHDSYFSAQRGHWHRHHRPSRRYRSHHGGLLTKPLTNKRKQPCEKNECKVK